MVRLSALRTGHLYHPRKYSWYSFLLKAESNTSRQHTPNRRRLCTTFICIARAEPDGTRAETRFRLSPKLTSPFKSAGASVQSTAGSRRVRISGSNAGYTTLRGRLRVLATHSIRQFPLHFPSRASPCANTFRTQCTLPVLSTSATLSMLKHAGMADTVHNVIRH